MANTLRHLHGIGACYNVTCVLRPMVGVMSKMSRTKGASGEREIAKILTDCLGFKVERKLGAARDGGSDIEIDTPPPGWSIEVKRREKLRVEKWWEQTERQADKEERRPLLLFRRNRAPWLAMYYHDEEVVMTDLLTWIAINYPFSGLDGEVEVNQHKDDTEVATDKAED